MKKLKLKKKPEEPKIPVWRQQVIDDVVPKIKGYLEPLAGVEVTPTEAYHFADFISSLVKYHSRNGISQEDYSWLISYINMLAWGFNGGIVLKN